jgi:hypothetical protein
VLTDDLIDLIGIEIAGKSNLLADWYPLNACAWTTLKTVNEIVVLCGTVGNVKFHLHLLAERTRPAPPGTGRSQASKSGRGDAD